MEILRLNILSNIKYLLFNKNVLKLSNVKPFYIFKRLQLFLKTQSLTLFIIQYKKQYNTVFFTNLDKLIKFT